MILSLIGAFIVLLGSLFLLLGSIGVYRMPDVYNRMQAGTKATTLGSILFYLGIGFIMPSWMGKLILLIVFIIFTNPVSSHALARASHYLKLKMTDKTVMDSLETDENIEGGEK